VCHMPPCGTWISSGQEHEHLKQLKRRHAELVKASKQVRASVTVPRHVESPISCVKKAMTDKIPLNATNTVVCCRLRDHPMFAEVLTR
jgi:hypothetical protein